MWLKQNGLPGNTINVGLQTSDGYLWFGMAAGLFRFDGQTFERISTLPTDDTKIETVSALCETEDGSLWVGTSISQLCRLKDGKIYRYGELEGINSMNINVLLKSRSRQFWVGTSYGLYRLNGDKFVSVPVTPRYITGIVEDLEGRIWVGTHAGIHIFEGDREVRTLPVTVRGNPQLVNTLYAARNGDIWIGTYAGLLRWSRGVMTTFTNDDGLSDNHVTTIYEDRDGNVWVGTTGGLDRYSGGKWSHFTARQGLSNNHVSSITEDHEGSLWVSTFDGLNMFKDVNVTTYTTEEGLVSDFISGVAQTPDGSMYFLSNEASAITRIKDGKFSKITTPVGPDFVSRDGSLWIGQTGSLSVIKDGHITQYNAKTGMPMKWISAICEDSESIILDINDIGVQRFKNGKLRPYYLKKGEPYDTIQYISCFFQDTTGALWMGTSRGLVRLRNGQVTTFGPADGMADYFVGEIYDDRRGSLWITSPHGGLTRLREGKFTVYNSKVGLFTDEINCVLADNQGDLWLGSQRGIGHVLRRDLDDYEANRSTRIHTQVLSTADGMKSDECFGGWHHAGWKAHDGRLWFSTNKGAVAIDPTSFTKNELIPQVFIKHVIADLKTIAPGNLISLSPGTEKLEFHYAALSYLVPDRVLFKYKLEGYDRKYVDAGTRRIAYYTNLPPGNYRFRVMACNNDGRWNETGANFAFTLEPHFYQTYWFYSVAIVLIAGGAFGAYRLRVWQLLKREKELEARVQEALTNIKILDGLIPICSNCKKIRDDKGYWDLLEGYIQSHSEAKFSHALCPDCAEKLYPDIFPLDRSS